MIGAVMALTLLTLGGAFAAIALAVNRAQERQLDAALLREAGEEAAEIASIGGRRPDDQRPPGPRGQRRRPAHEVRRDLRRRRGGDRGDAHLASRAPAPRRCPTPNARAPSTCYADLEHLRGVLVRVPGPTGARLLLAAPRADLDGDARFLRRAMAMVLLVACAWTLGLASWFARRLTRDHQRIMEVAPPRRRRATSPPGWRRAPPTRTSHSSAGTSTTP